MTSEPKIFILVDTSYWIFYRYFAIIQWWGHSNPESPLTNPYENEEFVEKFMKTFSESLAGFKKKQKIHKKKSTIISVRDCPRKDIWRNALYSEYKGSRTKDDGFNGGPFFKHIYQDNNKLLYEAGANAVLQFPNLEADDIIALTKNHIRQKYGDSTDSNSQLQALRSLGLKAEFRTDGKPETLKAEIDAGRPVAVGWLHHGHVTAPSGGGHWTVVIGYDDTGFWMNDPYGSCDLVGGGYPGGGNPNDQLGKKEHYSTKNWVPRWMPAGSPGWYLTCKL